MGRTWTDAQREAIERRDHTLLVSAAAGSGKTAVLTERIIQTLLDEKNPTEITELLIVTFTRAAAGEMRHRIARALNEALLKHADNRSLTKHLNRQLMLLGSAHISTIDSFYLDLVKSNFEKAGLSPSFRMADEAELYTLRREVMNGVIDRMYKEHPAFHRVADVFADLQSESSLTEKLLDLSEKLEKLPEGAKILLTSAARQESPEVSPFDTAIGTVFYGTVRHYAEAGVALCEQLLAQITAEAEATRLTARYAPLYTELADRCRELLSALDKKDCDGVAHLLTAPFAERAKGGAYPPRSEEMIHLGELCGRFRKKFLELASKFGVFDRREIEEGGAEAASLLRLLALAMEMYERAYRAAKAEREVAEFSDVARAAYGLLVSPDGSPTPLAASIAATYKGVYIDEYQDVDAMQDATFRAISTKRNRFMVGDIKQSIYRFRGANPDVFAAYKRTLPTLSAAAKEDDAATIFMSNCFRCDESIIRFSNAVSGYLFRQSKESIGYTAADDLVFSKTENSGSAKCRVMILDPAKRQGEQAAEDEDASSDKTLDHGEARMIVAEIKRLLREEKKANGSPIQPGDIAVLSRSKAFAKHLSALLEEAGIAVNDTSRRNFFENPDVLCMYSLLAVIDNPQRDIYLAAVLRSPFFGFTLEELVAIRRSAESADSLFEAVEKAALLAESPTLRRRASAFLERLATYRTKAEILPASKLLRYLYRDTAVLSFGKENASGKKGHSRKANLLQLYEYARKFEAGSFKGLYQFVRYIEDVMSSETELPIPEGPANAVSFVTIHHSKGLEFPVCFVAGAASPFSSADQRPPLLCDGELGCGLLLPNAGVFSRADTFGRVAVSEALKRKSREEEMRILYVAMTRARERLYITGRPTGGADALLDRAALYGSKVTDFFATAGNSYLEWILSALAEPDHDAFCEVEIIPEASLTADATAPSALRESPVDPQRIAAIKNTLKERFSFVYPFSHLSQLPAKLSVSRLSPEVLDVYDSDEATPANLSDPDVERLLHSFERVPLFGTEKRVLSAAERGTATHEFLQFCDFERTKRLGVAAELDLLIERRFLPEEARNAVCVEELVHFFESDLHHALSTASNIRRETRFHIFLPAADFTATKEKKEKLLEETILVQGVIDLFFTDKDGNLVLCDYKTDRLSPFELSHPEAAAKTLFARHGQQLAYYKAALTEICGKAPDKVLIYSLPLGRTLEEY